jgi:cytochrome c1
MIARAPILPEVLVCGISLAACQPADVPAHQRVVGGDPGSGRMIVERIACGACHEIPGMAGANGVVGPSLKDFGRRTMIAGGYANRPEALVIWVRNAPRMAPETAMPDLPLSENEARDVAAYLYTLR